MTVEEAADFLDLSRNTLYLAAREGRIPSFKVGALIRFDLDELRAWLDSNRPKAAKT
jgi:excisionase family DNA binding protein